MSGSGERSDSARWAVWEKGLFFVLPYPLLVLASVITVIEPIPLGTVRIALALGLSLVAAGWITWFVTLHPDWQDRRTVACVFYCGLTVLAGALVALAPWYGMFAFLGYIYAFDYLRDNWRFVGVAVTAVTMATSQMGGVQNLEGVVWAIWGLVFAVNVVMATGFSYLNIAVHERNAKLEAALEENAGLHAQLLVQAREAGVLDERQRMAREIHDTLAQGLAGIITQLQAAEQANGEEAEWRRRVATAAALARDSLAEARRSVHAVEPVALAEARLPDAIGEVTRQWASAHSVAAVLTTTGDARPMHPDVEVTLLRTAQEALANVAKHARASRVGLTLSYMEDLVTLDVRDDGVGFNPDTKRANGSMTGGFGLTGMRQRVQRLAGRLEIESEPGTGTAISASVPAIPAGGTA
jgi:signal transduction histidine kinase